jgi:hypothetical protein
MSSLPKEMRDRFQRSSEAATQTARTTQGLAAIEGVGGDARRTAYLWVVSILFDVVGFVTGKWANDPARDDFESSTRVRRPVIKEWAAASRPPPDALAETAFALSLDLDQADARLSAALRAYERLQGALRRNRDDEASGRRQEAIEYAREASPALDRIGRRLRTLNDQVADDPSWFAEPVNVAGDRMLRVPPSPPRSPPQLSDETLSVIFLAGTRVEALAATLSRRPARVWRPSRADAHVEAFRTLAVTLRNWEPEFPAREGP